jgi:hypothetical protein
MDPIVVLKGALPPILAALLLVSLAGVRLLPLAMAIGLHVAHGLLKGWPSLPHELWTNPNGTEWLLWGVVAAGLVALLEHTRLLPQKVAPATAVFVAAATVWLELGKLAMRWTSNEVLLHVGGGGIAVALVTLVARASIARAPAGIASAVVWSTILSLDSLLLTLASSAFLGQLCGAVAAAVGAAAGTVLWRRPFALSPADGTWIGVAHGGFVLAGMHLADLGWPAAAVAMLSPCALLLLRGGLAKSSFGYVVGALLLVVGANAWFVYDLIAAAPSGY